jgi:hypothetical protein
VASAAGDCWPDCWAFVGPIGATWPLLVVRTLPSSPKPSCFVVYFAHFIAFHRFEPLLARQKSAVSGTLIGIQRYEMVGLRWRGEP